MESAEKVLIIIPTYNERENLPLLVREVLATVPADVLVVDDNSPDGTGEVADRLASSEPRVHVLHRRKKEGLGKAYAAGFTWGLERGCDLLFEMDCDFSHQPKYLPDFLEKIKDADVVLGSRNVPGGGVENWSFLRKLVSKGGSIYARTILGLEIKDLTGGFKCFRRRVLETIDYDRLIIGGYGFQIEMTYRAVKLGFKVVETPIIFPDRMKGASKMTRKIFLEALVNIWKLRFAKVEPKALPPPG
ncbi:MAG: polyprenol monophosphomannose synthase [Deltaproteobacteria bacterium]|nr:polyprenol monophosphomannose synthase [Deltaproteobacteria bacterium]